MAITGKYGERSLKNNFFMLVNNYSKIRINVSDSNNDCLNSNINNNVDGSIPKHFMHLLIQLTNLMTGQGDHLPQFSRNLVHTIQMLKVLGNKHY
jgi:hypothetical protein